MAIAIYKRKLKNPPAPVDLNMFSERAVIQSLSLNRDGTGMEVTIRDLNRTFKIQASNYTIQVEYEHPYVLPVTDTQSLYYTPPDDTVFDD